uniref:Uncharacterized protein n=1 Tax=Rhizophora mucronata TaxID=61149 RepID=A0A2P2QYR1_RHIMU
MFPKKVMFNFSKKIKR